MKSDANPFAISVLFLRHCDFDVHFGSASSFSGNLRTWRPWWGTLSGTESQDGRDVRYSFSSIVLDKPECPHCHRRFFLYLLRMPSLPAQRGSLEPCTLRCSDHHCWLLLLPFRLRLLLPWLTSAASCSESFHCTFWSVSLSVFPSSFLPFPFHS